MKANIYKIEALTNLHAGSGDANYGIIDNLVQRDPVTTLPTINGSSLKGALKEFFEEQWDKDDDKVKQIFGSNDNNADYRFISANLLAIPVRSNKKAYFLATAPMVIEQLEADNENFFEKENKINIPNLTGICPEKGTPVIFTDKKDLLIEDFEDFNPEDAPEENDIFNNFENIVYMHNEDFKNLCNDTNLPVVARNKVGENLWYEQIVPHKSIFSFIVLHNKKHIADFNKEFENNIVHIGANATVGYGFTKIKLIETEKEHSIRT